MSTAEDLDKRPRFAALSVRSLADVFTLSFLLGGLVVVFVAAPVVTWYRDDRAAVGKSTSGYNLGGINGSGQYPGIDNWRTVIDKDTPLEVYQIKGHDEETWDLVFSDEFSSPGRSIFPGDDPFFEAVDLHYWVTGDLEWYDPAAVRTQDGHLQITLTQEPIHDLNFKSGMLQSWNKLCFFRNAHIEVSVSLPGVNSVGGFRPGIWAMGNLGRPGYGATTDGTWPYTYSSCDVGILPNQTWRNGTGPDAALNSGSNGGPLSSLPGQRLPSCTCQGEDHPGPSHSIGRGAVEIDMIEAQVVLDQQVGQVSQSFQLAPFDDLYRFNNSTTNAPLYDQTITSWNTYAGGPYQQAASALTNIDNDIYFDTSGEFRQFALEWSADIENHERRYITWWSQGKESWTLYQSAIGPNANTQINQRLIAEEPMAMIINLGMSNNFENVDFSHLAFPNIMRIDYIRVWQKPTGSLTCDPEERPTKDYIERHSNAYSNVNLTTWADAGYTFPKNKLTST